MNYSHLPKARGAENDLILFCGAPASAYVSTSLLQVVSHCLLLYASVAGVLFNAMHSSDADKLIEFLFPPERLPAHTQVSSSSTKLQTKCHVHNTIFC
jgi:hypothetical protein